MVMTRSVVSCLLVLLFSLTSLSDVNSYPSDFLENRDDLEQQLGNLWPFFGQLTEENDHAPRRDEALQKIQEILGIRSQSENLAHRKVPPQFMMELYNTIADPSGVTRGRNPYNAKVVRSFIERDSSLSHFFFFNISGLEVNESVLEAELHLYRKKIPLKNVRPLTFMPPYYPIRFCVYQVLDDQSLDMPDLHRLIQIYYIDANASGWQVFNVKQAVLRWMNGEPNLGLLVTASTLFKDGGKDGGEEMAVEFSRRNDYHHNKQPILVLFDDNKSDRSQSGVTNVARRYYVYGNQEDIEDVQQAEDIAYEKDAKNQKLDLENNYDSVKRYRRHKRQRGQLEEARLENRREPELFKRQKRRRDEEDKSDGSPSRYDGLPREPGTLTLEVTSERRRRDTVSSKKRSPKIVSSRKTRILTSMDIYKRATFRERLGQTMHDRSMRRSVARERRLTRSTTSDQGATTSEQNSTSGECTRHELYVDFRDIGLSSSIIAPAGYSAYQCKGVCEPPLRQDQQPTNHATIQAIVHEMGLVKGVERPCCVPTKLLSTSILFYDDNENVVLKMYEDMIADRCGCR